MLRSEWCLFQHAKHTNITLWANYLALDVSLFFSFKLLLYIKWRVTFQIFIICRFRVCKLIQDTTIYSMLFSDDQLLIAQDYEDLEYMTRKLDIDRYTGCHRRNGPNFGRVFLMINYTDITQNTYIQS